MYIGVSTQWHLTGTDLNNQGTNQQYNIVWGIQERLFNNLFIDGRLGTNLNGANQPDNPFFYDIHIGFAF